MKARKKPAEIEFRDAIPGEEIVTMEGTMRANPGDVIITGVEGEQYPCSRSVFLKTYESACRESSYWFARADRDQGGGPREGE